MIYAFYRSVSTFIYSTASKKYVCYYRNIKEISLLLFLRIIPTALNIPVLVWGEVTTRGEERQKGQDVRCFSRKRNQSGRNLPHKVPQKNLKIPVFVKGIPRTRKDASKKGSILSSIRCIRIKHLGRFHDSNFINIFLRLML